MININLSNMVGDSSLSQSKSVSSDSLSTFKDFISEFKLEDENSGTNTNNKEDVDESLILYNLIIKRFINSINSFFKIFIFYTNKNINFA